MTDDDEIIYMAQPFGISSPISMENLFDYYYEDPIGLSGFQFPGWFNGFFYDGELINIPAGHYEDFRVVGMDADGFVYVERVKKTEQSSTSTSTSTGTSTQQPVWTLANIKTDTEKIMSPIFGSNWKTNAIDIATYIYTTYRPYMLSEEKRKISAAEVYVASCFVDGSRVRHVSVPRAVSDANRIVSSVKSNTTVYIVDTRDLPNLIGIIIALASLDRIFVSTTRTGNSSEIVIDSSMYAKWDIPGRACSFCDIKKPPDEVFDKFLVYLYLYLVSAGKTVYMISHRRPYSMYPIQCKVYVPSTSLLKDEEYEIAGPEELKAFVNKNKLSLLEETQKLFS